jgi:predicted ester cyclase
VVETATLDSGARTTEKDGAMMAVDLDTDLAARSEALERWGREWIERTVNQYDLSIIDERVEETFACSNTTMWAVQGVQGIHESYERLHRAFPDANAHVQDVFAKASPSTGDKITVWWTLSAIHSGPLVLERDRGTIEPTGRKVTISTVSMFELEHWKLVSTRVISDMMLQLGVLPPPVQQHG